MADRAPKATLGGLPIDSDVAGWTFSEGTEPSRGIFTLAPEHAKQLFEAGKEVDLVLDPQDGTPPLVVKRLFVIGYDGSPHPAFGRVVVADIRWRWAYPVVVQGYNMLRRSGVKFSDTDGEVPAALKPTEPTQAFRRWSLKGGGAGGVWRADEVLTDVITKVSGQGPAFDDGLAAKFAKHDVENIDLAGNADIEIRRALGFVAEAGIWVDENAQVRIFDRTSGADLATWGKALPEDAEGGHVVLNDLRWLRPEYVEILYPIEGELRLDFEENTGGTVAQIEDRLVVQNVLAVPDYELEIGSQKHARGAYVVVDDAFTGWNSAAAGALPGGLSWSQEIVQRGFIPFGGKDMFAAMEALGDLAANADHAGRINAARAHYRQTFRINPRWMDGILSIAAHRVHTISLEYGTRADAVVYADHTIVPAARGKLMFLDGDQRLYRASQVDGLASSSSIIGSGVRRAPATVSVIDSDNGIIHIEYQTYDPYGQVAAILPSKVDNIPVADPKQQRSKPYVFGAVKKNSDVYPKLASAFKAAIILTAIPAGPNNANRYFRVRVTPAELADVLGTAAGLGNAKGPPLQYVSEEETARVVWVDSRGEDIKKLFGIGFVEGTPPPKIDDLVVNYTEGGAAGVNAASLSSLSRSIAASIYASFADGPVGEMTGWLNKDVRIGGALSSVRHEISKDGKPVTKLAFSTQQLKPSIYTLLDPHSRRVLRKGRAGT